jgi:hypothetical protein
MKPLKQVGSTYVLDEKIKDGHATKETNVQSQLKVPTGVVNIIEAKA